MDPITFEILRHRLWAINDEAATTISRVSGSPIATEANDVNTALMAPDGQVVVTGIYILVQVVSLSRVIEDIRENYQENPGIRPGDMFITNDPYVGAPHQPDVIVVAPIFSGADQRGTVSGDRLIAWSGSVVHQSDVGGPTAGSINVTARSIYEEPIPMPPVRIVEGGLIRKDIEREYLIRSRTPELNALDLLGQVAANRLQTERILALCDRYGTDAVTGTMDQLASRTESRFRERLASLPDGRWRHHSYLEHDGLTDAVYLVALTMTKRGDRLTLDFTESSDEAPTGVNATLATTQNFAMAAVMALLGYGISWVPAGFWPAVELLTREGSLVHARWPASVSMSVNAAGQEVRTCVNACVARMLDGCAEQAGKVMASGVSSAPAQTIAGRTQGGERFGTMLLDGLLGGGGARAFADGADVCGILTSPGASCSNIEVVEHNYPVLYDFRRERPDSGGPGTFRGGIGGEVGYRPHRAAGAIDMTVFAHGVEQPTATGVLGGEPAAPAGILLSERPLPPKAHANIEPDDVYRSWCAGGGGYGDPLDRPIPAVLDDVADGLVSVEGARRDYGVVVGDPDATDALRQARRVARLGREPLRRDYSGDGRRLGSALLLADDVVRCRYCGTGLGPGTDNVRRHLVLEEISAAEQWPSAGRYEGSHRFVLRRYHCPGCATQLDTEVALLGEEPVWAAELLPPADLTD
jgi:N-methylhydantoinase B